MTNNETKEQAAERIMSEWYADTRDLRIDEWPEEIWKEVQEINEHAGRHLEDILAELKAIKDILERRL
jgi:hypothetical protein